MNRAGPLVRKTPMRRTGIKRKRVRPRRHPSLCSWSPRCRSLYTPVHVSETEQLCRTHGMMTADTLVSLIVRARDGQCIRCATDRDLEWAHIHTRGARYIRWDLDAAVTLCHGCHAYYTDHPEFWRGFVESKFPGLYTRLLHREIAHERAGGHVDIAAVIRGVRETAA